VIGDSFTPNMNDRASIGPIKATASSHRRRDPSGQAALAYQICVNYGSSMSDTSHLIPFLRNCGFGFGITEYKRHEVQRLHVNVCAHQALHYKGGFIHSEDTMVQNISVGMIYDEMIRIFPEYENVLYISHFR
jgi:hypothetical protein